MIRNELHVCIDNAILEAATLKLAVSLPRRRLGRLVEVRGPVVRVAYQGLRLGNLCKIDRPCQEAMLAEVIGLDNEIAVLCPFGSTDGLVANAIVTSVEAELAIPTGNALLGRVIDVFGTPIDGNGVLDGDIIRRPIKSQPPAAMDRPLICDELPTGIRAIDGPLTLAKGQRVGIFGPPGTGKSGLLAAITQHTCADIIVIALVGERGREVREFVERELPAENRKRVVVVVATSDRPAVERALCSHSATTVAERFRDDGKSVLLLVDSLTRSARALREVGLAAGEAPTRRGYPASVYPALPAIIERAGRTDKGDITAMYTVLTESDGQNDPIAEEVKSLTDGHIILSSDLASAGHFPAIDVIQSLSRSMNTVAKREHVEAAGKLRSLMVKYTEIELLLQVGEYTSGGDTLADKAIAAKPKIDNFLRQKTESLSEFLQTVQTLQGVVK